MVLQNIDASFLDSIYSYIDASSFDSIYIDESSFDRIHVMVQYTHIASSL